MQVKQIQPYLFFGGRAEEAIGYYQRVLGAEVEMKMRFGENPDAPEGVVPSEWADKIMHASLKIGSATLMLSDGMSADQQNFAGISITAEVPTAEEADRVFSALERDGQVQMPIGKTFFSPRFGAVVDKFGVSWMVIATPMEQAAAA